MWANGSPCDCVHIQARSDEFFKHDLHVGSHMPPRVQLCGSCHSRASSQLALGSKALCLDWVSAQLPAPVVRMFTARLQLYWACLTTTRGSEDHSNTWLWLKWHSLISHWHLSEVSASALPVHVWVHILLPRWQVKDLELYTLLRCSHHCIRYEASIPPRMLQSSSPKGAWVLSTGSPMHQQKDIFTVWNISNAFGWL